MRRLVSVLTGVLLATLVPSVVYAQASIAGVVKDASGAVLPGVTVEAASPVLIEKVRSVVTDDSGQYRIVDLRPGTYSVTFTLAGFSVVKYPQIASVTRLTLSKVNSSAMIALQPDVPKRIDILNP